MKVAEISIETIRFKSGSMYQNVVVFRMEDGSLRLPLEESGGFALPVRANDELYGEFEIVDPAAERNPCL